jgi:hypothetical protein
LTECGDVSEVEAEETETAAVAVQTAKMAEATETAAVMVKVAATLKMVVTAEAT